MTDEHPGYKEWPIGDDNAPNINEIELEPGDSGYPEEKVTYIWHGISIRAKRRDVKGMQRNE